MINNFIFQQVFFYFRIFLRQHKCFRTESLGPFSCLFPILNAVLIFLRIKLSTQEASLFCKANSKAKVGPYLNKHTQKHRSSLTLKHANMLCVACRGKAFVWDGFNIYISYEYCRHLKLRY